MYETRGHYRIGGRVRQGGGESFDQILGGGIHVWSSFSSRGESPDALNTASILMLIFNEFLSDLGTLLELSWVPKTVNIKKKKFQIDDLFEVPFWIDFLWIVLDFRCPKL